MTLLKAAVKSMIKIKEHGFRYRGLDIKIHPLARIVKPEVIEIDDFAMIDDFAFINGGAGIKIGKYVHIGSFASVVGGGELVIEDYATIGQGTKIITAADGYLGDDMASAAVDENSGTATGGRVIIEKGAFIGNDVMIHPNVRIGQGSVIDSYSRVVEDVRPKGINRERP